MSREQDNGGVRRTATNHLPGNPVKGERSSVELNRCVADEEVGPPNFSMALPEAIEPRGKCEPVVWLAPAVLKWKIRGAEDNDEVGKVSESVPPATTHAIGAVSPALEGAKLKPIPGPIHIELRQAQVRIEGVADLGLERVLLECPTR